MPAPKPIPEDILVQILKRREEVGNEPAGAWALQEWPKLFAGCSSLSAIEHVKKRAKRAGLDVSKMPSGGGALQFKLKTPEPNRSYIEESPELVIPFQERVLVISDLHAPLHNRSLIERSVAVTAKRNLRTLILNGDTLDNAYKGHKGLRDVAAAPFAEGLYATAAILDDHIRHGIEDIFVIQGNHDDKPLRITDGEITFEEFFHAKVSPLMEEECNVKVTNRYYLVMEPRTPKAWPWDSPDHFPTFFTHQKNYGKNPLSVAMEMCSVYGGNIITGHQHHLAQGVHKNGICWIADAGTFQDPNLARYKNERQSRHPMWGCGFITVEHGIPQLWPFAAPQQWWDLQLR